MIDESCIYLSSHLNDDRVHIVHIENIPSRRLQNSTILSRRPNSVKISSVTSFAKCTYLYTRLMREFDDTKLKEAQEQLCQQNNRFRDEIFSCLESKN